MFSHIWDKYNKSLKNTLLMNLTTGKKEIAKSCKWDDLNHVSENSKNKKQYMKKSIALHFTRAIYANENKIQNY